MMMKLVYQELCINSVRENNKRLIYSMLYMLFNTILTHKVAVRVHASFCSEIVGGRNMDSLSETSQSRPFLLLVLKSSVF